jgi:hypothetical protein
VRRSRRPKARYHHARRARDALWPTSRALVVSRPREVTVPALVLLLMSDVPRRGNRRDACIGRECVPVDPGLRTRPLGTRSRRLA